MINLILIQMLAARQTGYLAGIREKLPSSHGASEELDQSIVTNMNILEEVSDAIKQTPVKARQWGTPTDNVE